MSRRWVTWIVDSTAVLARYCSPSSVSPALLPAEDERVGQQAGAGHVHRLVGLEGHPEHEGLDVAAAELVPDDVPRRQDAPPLPDPAARVLGQPRIHRGDDAARWKLGGS